MDPIPKDDICVLLPNKMVQDMGESDVLPSKIYQIVLGLFNAGYAPFDFGEEHDTHTELHFTLPMSDEELKVRVKDFVDKGGWV